MKEFAKNLKNLTIIGKILLFYLKDIKNNHKIQNAKFFSAKRLTYFKNMIELYA